MKAVWWIVLAMAPTAAVAQEPVALNLTCTGKLDTLDMEKTRGTISDPKDATKSAEVETQRWVENQVDARMSIAIEGGAGRAKPDWKRKKSDGGWYAIEDLSVGDDEITGAINMGFLSKSRVRIDRHTGDIRYGDFKGVCEKSATAPNERKF